MKTCRKCGENKALDGFYAHPAGADGVAEKCKECHKAAMRKNRAAKADYYREYDRQRFQNDPKRRVKNREYKKTKAGRESAKRARLKYEAKYPDKRAAHIAFGNAVTYGKITRPNTCSKCGTKGLIEGHHEDYSKPFDVIWLCRPCHLEVHR